MGYLRKLLIDGYIKMKVVVPYVELLIVKKNLNGLAASRGKEKLLMGIQLRKYGKLIVYIYFKQNDNILQTCVAIRFKPAFNKDGCALLGRCSLLEKSDKITFKRRTN